MEISLKNLYVDVTGQICFQVKIWNLQSATKLVETLRP